MPRCGVLTHKPGTTWGGRERNMFFRLVPIAIEAEILAFEREFDLHYVGG